jgi:hypothetical protein
MKDKINIYLKTCATHNINVAITMPAVFASISSASMVLLVVKPLPKLTQRPPIINENVAAAIVIVVDQPVIMVRKL